MLSSKLAGEELHRMGEIGARTVKRWLESTTRFQITHDIYGTGPEGAISHLRVGLLDGTVERFDLFGHVLDTDGQATDSIHIECKDYSAAGDQGDLYFEYLAVCYSAYARDYARLQTPPSMQFMWATTHPFAQTKYRRLSRHADGLPEEIETACVSHAARLGEYRFDPAIADELGKRLWLCIVNPRVEEMMMSPAMLGEVRKILTKGTT
jgi:hypothetical protein